MYAAEQGAAPALHREAIRTQFQTAMVSLADPTRPGHRSTLAEVFRLSGRWISAYLDVRPDAKPQALTEDLKRLGTAQISVGATAVQLTRAAYVVVVDLEAGFGYPFAVALIVARIAGEPGLRAGWRARTLAKPRRPLRGAWDLTLLTCGVENGPLDAEVHALPRSRRGWARFYIEATSGNGSCNGKEVSIWEWNGARALPLILHSYLAMPDEQPTFAKNILTIPTKEETRILSGSCSDVEPQGKWVVKVTPNGVADVGHFVQDPEYLLIDELLYRTAHHYVVTDIARPQIARELATLFPASRQYGKDYYYGQVVSWAVTREGWQTIAHLQWMGAGEMWFSVERRRGKAYVTGLRLERSGWPDELNDTLRRRLVGVRALALMGSSLPVLAVGADNGVAFISDLGGSPSVATLASDGPQSVHALAVDPAQPTTVYAGTSDGLFRSTDTGASWTKVLFGSPEAVIAVRRPGRPSAAYAGGTLLSANPTAPEASGLVESTNGGNSWVVTAASFGARSVFALAAAPSAFYAGTSRGVFKSTNGGGTWVRAGSELIDTPVFALAIDPKAPAIVYAGTFGTGVFKSTDAGQTWRAVNRGFKDKHVSALAITPSDPPTIYAGTEPGLYRSTDEGATWQLVPTGVRAPVVLSLTVDPANPQHVYAGTAHDDVISVQPDRPNLGSVRVGTVLYWRPSSRPAGRSRDCRPRKAGAGFKPSSSDDAEHRLGEPGDAEAGGGTQRDRPALGRGVERGAVARAAQPRLRTSGEAAHRTVRPRHRKRRMFRDEPRCSPGLRARSADSEDGGRDSANFALRLP